MNLRFEILKAVAANPGAPINEIADAISYDRQKTAWSVRDCAQDGLLAKRLDDVTRQPGYTLTDAGKKRLAEGPAKLQGGNLKKGAKAKTSFNAGPRDRAEAKAKVEAVSDQVAAAAQCATRAAAVIDQLTSANRDHLNMIAIASETLAAVVHSATDTSDMDLDELAKHVADALTTMRDVRDSASQEFANVHAENERLRGQLQTIDETCDRVEKLIFYGAEGDTAFRVQEMMDFAVQCIKTHDVERKELRSRLANQTALVEKLEHLLQSARNEAEHLRRHANHSGDAADMVNHPPHYQGKVECIDAIEAALGQEGFVAYCRGNALKYSFRAGRKGDAAQDIKKALWYAARALQTINPPASLSVPA